MLIGEVDKMRGSPSSWNGIPGSNGSNNRRRIIPAVVHRISGIIERGNARR